MRVMDTAVDEWYVDSHVLGRLATAAETTARDYGRAFGGLLELARHTGLHLGELVALETRDVDVRTSSLIVRRTWPHRSDGPKELDVRGRRTVSLSEPARRALAQLDWHPEATIVIATAGGPLSPNGFALRFRQVAVAAGFGALRYADLRLSYLQDLTAAGNTADWVGAQLGVNAQTVRDYWRKLGLRRPHESASVAPSATRSTSVVDPGLERLVDRHHPTHPASRTS